MAKDIENVPEPFTVPEVVPDIVEPPLSLRLKEQESVVIVLAESYMLTEIVNEEEGVGEVLSEVRTIEFIASVPVTVYDLEVALV